MDSREVETTFLGNQSGGSRSLAGARPEGEMMRWLEKIRIRSQMLFHRRRESQRLDAELAFHLEQQIAENVARGMSSEEAGYAARRAFGNTMILREQARDTWSWTTLELLLQNLRISMRTLARAPAFAFVSILVIAIGIGANLALFTVVRSVLMKPLPFEDPERLVRLYEHSADDKFPYNEVAGGIFTEWKKQSHGFSDLAIVLSWPQYNLSGTRGQLPERVRAAFCSWNLLPALGVEPALRRRSHDPESDHPPRWQTLHCHRHHALLVRLSGTERATLDARLPRTIS